MEGKTIRLKGKTLVALGRNRGLDLEGNLIRWTTEDQTVEVSEAQAKVIEADKSLTVVRLDEAPSVPEGSVILTPEDIAALGRDRQQLLDRAEKAESEVDRLSRQLAEALAAMPPQPVKGDAKAEAKPEPKPEPKAEDKPKKG